MYQNEILNKRNLFVFHSFIIVNFIYFLMIALGMYKEIYLYHAVFTFSAIIIINIMFWIKVNQLLLLYAILLTWNFSTVIIIVESHEVVAFFWFIFLLIITLIYRMPLLSAITFGVLCFEIVILLKVIYPTHIQKLSNYPELPMFYIIMLILMSIVQFIYISKIWNHKERKTMHREMELSSKEGYLRLFFENADDAITVFDLDNKIIEVNPAFENLYGWKREECIGKTIPLVPPCNLDASIQRYNRILQGESFQLLTTQDMRKDGTLIDVQITLFPIYNDRGEMIASSVISRDISFMKEHERLVLQSEKLKVVGEIAAGLAHEIRNPMTVISGFVQMMNADEHSPYKNYTELIQSEVERINLILSEFLVLSRPQKEEYQKLSINEVIDSIIDLYSLENEQCNITVSKKTNNMQAYINGNINQIKQVFINLFKNAIEAIERDGQIDIELYCDNNVVSICLKDTGIGIPEHVLERIFEPFYTTKTKGTGLGMIVTNKIIQEHKGSIKIRSKEKVGTEILIHLPCIEVVKIENELQEV